MQAYLAANTTITIARTREDYIKQFRAHWAKSVEGIIEAGKVLLEAKTNLNRAQFLKMLEDDEFPVSENTAYRLIDIAKNPVLTDFAHVQKLPPHWGTLYELTKLTDKEAGGEIDRWHHHGRVRT